MRKVLQDALSGARRKRAPNALRRVGQDAFLAILLGATIFAGVRCSDSSTSSDFNSPPTNDDDGGSDADVPLSDAGKDTGTPLVVILTNTAASAFDFRVCFATSRTSDGASPRFTTSLPFPSDARVPMPQANYPGVGRGNAVVLASELADGGATKNEYVVPYLIDAFALVSRPSQTCSYLLSECGGGTSCLKAPEIVKLSPFPATTFLQGGTVLLAVVEGKIGLDLRSITLDGRLVGEGLGAQFVQLAPTLGPVTVRYGSLDGGGDPSTAHAGSGDANDGEGGAGGIVSDGVSLGTAGFGAVIAERATALMPPSMAAFGATGFVLASESLDGGAPLLLRASLADIERASDPSRTPDELFKTRANYAFVLTGDPAVASTFVDGGPNPDYAARGLHVVVVQSSATSTDGGAF